MNFKMKGSLKGKIFDWIVYWFWILYIIGFYLYVNSEIMKLY